MNDKPEPTTADIQGRHDELTRHYADADKEREHWQTPAGYENQSHYDRGILLKRLEKAEKVNLGLSLTLTVAGEQLEAAENEVLDWRKEFAKWYDRAQIAEQMIKDMAPLHEQWRTKAEQRQIRMVDGGKRKPIVDLNRCADELQAILEDK